MKFHRLLLPILGGLALAAVLLSAAVCQSQAALERNPSPLSLVSHSAPTPRQTDSPQATTRYVATTGVDSGDCTDSVNPCRTVQYAVDRATEGDEVRVAAGVYDDLHIRPRQDITTTGSVTQVVYISKTVTIQGGYSPADWTTPDPSSNPTILDAHLQGRVIYISGAISPTLSGLQITGGDASNQGGWDTPDIWWSDIDVGGGMYMITATATVSDCEFYNNSSPEYGGAAALVYSMGELFGNQISMNTAINGGGVVSILGYNRIISNTFSNNTGGGLYLRGVSTLQTGDERVISNTFEGNTGGLGGGIFLEYAPPTTISRNTLLNNIADQGGGIYAYYSDPTLSRNRIHANIADSGGGLYLLEYFGVMDSNVVAQNSADFAGGFYLDGGAPTVSNNIVVNNDGGYFSSGIAIDRTYPGWLINNTIAKNTGGYGMGITVMANNQITFTNTIIVSQTIGIFVPQDNNLNRVVMEGTLWGSGIWANGQDWLDDSANPGTFYTGTVNVWGDPGFVDPDNGDYHIHQGSAAIDAGVNADIYNDIDGEPRPVGAGFDIGADELQTGTRYVAKTGADIGACTDPANPCRTVQYAVDRAIESDEVRVAAGEYSSINDYGSWTQVVYLTKTLTIQGGYTLTNWIIPNPIANQTSLKRYDSSGTLVYIFGHISPTLAGFDITGGLNGAVSVYADATIQYNRFYRNQGTGLVLQDTRANVNNNSFFDNGSGIDVNNGNPKISNNVIEKSIGDGIFMDGVDGETVVANNVISGNQGTGVWLGAAPVLITDNQILSNTQSGIRILNCDYYPGKHTIIENNLIKGNSTLDYGGGIAVDTCGPIIRNNFIINNYAEWQGGGIALVFTPYVPAIIEGNTIISNSSNFGGGGAFLATGSTFVPPYSNQFVNNIVAHNRSEGVGSGISLRDASLNLAHNTIAQNIGGDGSGIHIHTGGGNYFQPTLYNNIIVSHTVGITVGAGSTATLEGTLWGSGAWANGEDWSGDGIITGTVNVWGDPGFVDPNYGDYHIHQISAALDAGVDAGVYSDIDGEPRPAGTGFDSGADELQAALKLALKASPDPVASGDDLTYTLLVTNTGAVDLTAAITLTLPGQVTPGGVRSWTATLPVTGNGWSRSVAVTVDAGFAGPLTTTLQASTPQGAQGTVTSTVTAIQPVAGLQANSSSPTALGQTTAFTATVSEGGDASYTWDFGDGASAGGVQASHIYLSEGVYTATVTANNPVSSQSQQVAVIVEEAITGLSIASSSPTELGQATAFTATVTAGSNASFTWDFGDGASGSGAQTSHTYPDVGFNTATVTATNLVSQAAASTNVTVSQPGYRLYLPLSLKAYTLVPGGAVEMRLHENWTPGIPQLCRVR